MSQLLRPKINIVILLNAFLSFNQFAVAMHKKPTPKSGDRLVPVFSNNGRKEFIHQQIIDHENNSRPSPHKKPLAEISFNNCDFEGKNLLAFQEEKQHVEPYADRLIKDNIKLPAPKKLKYSEPRAIRTYDAQGVTDDFYLTLMDSSPQNTLAVAIGDSIYILDPSNRKPDTSYTNLLKPSDIEYEENLITSVHFVGQGKYLVAGTEDGTLLVWDLSDNKLIRKINAHEGRIGIITSLAKNSPIIFTGSFDNNIRQFDLTKYEPLVATYSQSTNAEGKGHMEEVCGLAVDPTGNFLISGGNDNEVFIWDLKTPSNGDNYTVFRLENGHCAAVKAIAWHPNGQYLATGGGTVDKYIKIWDIKTKQPILEIDTKSQVSSLNWVGNRLFSTHGFVQNSLQTWIINFNNNTIENEYECRKKHENRIMVSTFLNKQQTLVTLGADGRLILWDVSQEQQNINILNARDLEQRHTSCLESRYIIR